MRSRTTRSIPLSVWMNPVGSLSVIYVRLFHVNLDNLSDWIDEYVRNGVAEIFLEVEPLTGKRHVEVTEHRARTDWAWWIKGMLDERYPMPSAVRLVMDNLNTHSVASLYETFEPQEARRLTERLEIHYTPKHGSWLNMAEIELSALKGQCLDCRIPDMETMRKHVAAWENDRNNRISKIVWQFSTSDARVKLKHLYPKL